MVPYTAQTMLWDGKDAGETSERVCRPSHGAPELSLENQDGTVMRFENDEDRRALITGLSLHEKGRTSLKQVSFGLQMLLPVGNYVILACAMVTLAQL